MWKLLLGSLAIVSLAYWVYEPLDGDFEQPWKIRLNLRILDITFYIGDACEFLGIDTRVNVIRKLWNAASKTLSPGEDPALRITDSEIDGVPVRIYIPLNADKAPLPAVIYFHGGGWVLGSIHTVDNIARRMARSLTAVIINVEYRMAPEVTFPVPLHDCTAVTKYLLTNANLFNVDPARIAIGGDSAGGNLAAAISLRLRDEKFTPRVKLQLMVYPGLQPLNLLTPSCQQNAEGPLLYRRVLGYYWSMYLQGNPTNMDSFLKNAHIPFSTKDIPQLKYLDNDKLPKEFLERPYNKSIVPKDYDKGLWRELQEQLLNPYLAPLLADDLSGLPEAYLLTCHLDVLRDEGFWYAERLREAGNAVTYKHYRNAFHGILNMHEGPLGIKEGNEIMQDLIDFLKSAL